MQEQESPHSRRTSQHSFHSSPPPDQAETSAISSAPAVVQPLDSEADSFVDIISDLSCSSAHQSLPVTQQGIDQHTTSSNDIPSIQQKLNNLPQHCQHSVLVLGHVMGLISTEELQDAVHGDGRCALVIGNGPAACINKAMISKVKRAGGRLLHSDRTAFCNSPLEDTYKMFNSRVSELTGRFSDNDAGYRAYQGVLQAERKAALSCLEHQSSSKHMH